MKQATRRNYRNVSSSRVRLVQAAVGNIPFPDNRFDVVFEINSFHHWEDPTAPG
ncbi:MAG: methyltransferase domain-containing protein [Spirochaetia bacterium]